MQSSPGIKNEDALPKISIGPAEMDRSLVSSAAKAGDHGTAGLVAKRLAAHEKAVWTLRSMLNP